MQPTMQKPGISTENPIIILEKEQKIQSGTEESVTAHVQTESDKEHAKAQLEKFSRETSPVRIAIPEKETKKIDETPKIEIVEEISKEQLDKISLIQKALLTDVIKDPQILIGIQGMLFDPENAQKVKAFHEDFEKTLEPEAKALFAFLTNAASMQIKQIFTGMPFLTFPAADMAITVAVQRVLKDKIKVCKEAIHSISPQYLKNILAAESENQMGTVYRVGELVSKLNTLSSTDLSKLAIILLLDGKQQEDEVIANFGDAVPPIIKETFEFVNQIEDANTRQSVIDGLQEGIRPKIQTV